MIDSLLLLLLLLLAPSSSFASGYNLAVFTSSSLAGLSVSIWLIIGGGGFTLFFYLSHSPLPPPLSHFFNQC